MYSCLQTTCNLLSLSIISALLFYVDILWVYIDILMFQYILLCVEIVHFWYISFTDTLFYSNVIYITVWLFYQSSLSKIISHFQRISLFWQKSLILWLPWLVIQLTFSHSTKERRWIWATLESNALGNPSAECYSNCSVSWSSVQVFIQRGSSARSSKLETMQVCRGTGRPLVGSLRSASIFWCVMSRSAFVQSAQINIHARNMPYPLLMNGRGGERVRECKEGGRWRRRGEIIISPPSVNKPTPHYQCMREGCGGRKRWRQYALTSSHCHYLKLAAEHDYPELNATLFIYENSLVSSALWGGGDVFHQICTLITDAALKKTVTEYWCIRFKFLYTSWSKKN